MSENNRPEAEVPETPPETGSVAPVAETAAPPKKKKGYVKYSPLSLLLLAVCAFVFSFSILGLFEQVVLDTAGGEQMDELVNVAFPDNNSGSGGNNGGDSGDDGNSFSPVTGNQQEWQAIAPGDIDPQTLPFLQSVEFSGLLEQNPDTVAWMYWPTTADVKGLPFNLPVVQGANNEFYLDKGFDQSYSENGWVYADYRGEWSDITANRNLILYGHARSYLIFGGLRFLNGKTKWQQDGYNHFIYINTPTERTVWQVFSWYETTVDFNYINTYFSTDAEYLEFLNAVQNKNTISAFEKFQFTPEDRILTLSTCKGNDDRVRVAVHALLVKHEYVDGNKSPFDQMDDTPLTDVPVFRPTENASGENEDGNASGEN